MKKFACVFAFAMIFNISDPEARLATDLSSVMQSEHAYWCYESDCDCSGFWLCPIVRPNDDQ